MAVYYNVFESLKKGTGGGDLEASRLKQHYVSLGLIPNDNQWPNPARDWLMNKALSKLHEFWKALTNIIGRWRRRLTDELNLEPTMAVGFQMTMSFPPAFTITVQPELTFVRTS